MAAWVTDGVRYADELRAACQQCMELAGRLASRLEDASRSARESARCQAGIAAWRKLVEALEAGPRAPKALLALAREVLAASTAVAEVAQASMDRTLVDACLRSSRLSLALIDNLTA